MAVCSVSAIVMRVAGCATRDGCCRRFRRLDVAVHCLHGVTAITGSEVRTHRTLLKELRCPQRGEFLRDSDVNELIEGGPFSSSHFFGFRFD